MAVRSRGVTGPRVPVDGPQAQPGRRGLLQAAVPANLPTGWENGFSFDADSCDVAGPQPIECGPLTPAKNVVANAGIVDYNPFLTFGVDRCSTMDNGRDREGRARRNLIATESWQIEREFFDGVATKAHNEANGSPGDIALNPYLTDGETASAAWMGSLPTTLALARLERALIDCLHGQRGMIHATPDVVTMWQSGGALRVEGNTLLTVLDTIVVPGSGYSGNGPDGTNDGPDVSWAYGTGLVYLQQGQIIDAHADFPQARVDRDVNTTTWRFERINALLFATCCVIGVAVDMTVAGNAGGGGVDGGSP